ncbi:hypothetical protein PMAYCL1PPCAC_24825, partial [Pristionchus mayeri]
LLFSAEMRLLPNIAMFDEMRRMDVRQVIYQFLSLAMVGSSALMLWKGFFILTGTSAPITVVISGSMEPAFFRGDVLVLVNDEEDPVRVGDITVFKVEGKEIPIVHRVIKVHEVNKNVTKILTKGDNNRVDDRGLYAPGQMWLTKEDLVGRAKFILPHIGMVTILMNENPKLKYAVLFFLGLFVITHRER